MRSGKKASPVDTQGSRMGGGGPPDDGVQWGRAGFWRLLEAEMRPPRPQGASRSRLRGPRWGAWVRRQDGGAAVGGLGRGDVEETNGPQTDRETVTQGSWEPAGAWGKQALTREGAPGRPRLPEQKWQPQASAALLAGNSRL